MPGTLVLLVASLILLPADMPAAQEPPTAPATGDLKALLGWLEHLKSDIIDPGEGTPALSNPDHYVAHQLHDVAGAAVETAAFAVALLEIRATLCSQDQVKFRSIALQQVQRALAGLDREITRVDKVIKFTDKDHIIALGLDLRNAVTQLQAQLRNEFLGQRTANGA